MFEENNDGYLSYEYCNNETLKKHKTIVCYLRPFYWYRPEYAFYYINGERVPYEDITEDHLPELLTYQMFEEEPDYNAYGSNRWDMKKAGFFGVWSVKEIRDARMNGLISPEQWDRLWPVLKVEAEGYDTDPEFKRSVMDLLPPFANMTLVEYLDRELNFPISPETVQELAAKTVRYVNGTIKRTNITPSGAGDIVKPMIDQAVKNLVGRRHPSKIYDKDIREEFDNLSKGMQLPPIGNKEFYAWVGELGYQWVVDPNGKPVRSHGNRKVLSCFKSDGTHLTQDTLAENELSGSPLVSNLSRRDFNHFTIDKS